MKKNRIEEELSFKRLSLSKRRKICLIMKNFILLMLVFNLTAVANTNGQRLKKFEVKDASLKSCIFKIQKVTNYGFIYNGLEIEKIKGISLNLKNVDLKDVLDAILKGTNFCYEITDKVIAIKKINLSQQQNIVKVKGHVQDKEGDPLPGVTIKIKGTVIGVVTNEKGDFNLSFNKSDKTILVFSFIGMKTQEFKYKGQDEINVVLLEDVKELDDVVITGYENVRKVSYTGNAVRVKGEELLKVGGSDVISALQVFDPSFRIMENNEMGSNPNTVPEFYIRGQSGIGSKELDVTDLSESKLKNNPNLPIFILDGVDTSVQEVYDMDPNRIKTITILKDAAATAVYGSRASNGVIVIETKTPRMGKFNVSYNFTGSITTPDLSSYNYFNAKEKLEVEKLTGYYDVNNSHFGTINEELTAKENLINAGVDTYWLSQPLRTGFNQRHSVSIDGGVDFIRYGINLSYATQEGVMKDDYRNTLNTSLRLDYKRNDLMIINTISFNKTLSKGSPYGNFSNYVDQLPYLKVKGENGDYIKQYTDWYTTTLIYNPMYEGAVTNNYSKGNILIFKDNLNVDWYINDHFTLKGKFSISKQFDKTNRFTDPNSATYTTDTDYFGDLYTSESENTQMSSNLQLLFNRRFKNHYINTSLGFEARQSNSISTTARYSGFPSGELSSIMYAQIIRDKPSQSDNKTRSLGAFFRVNYSYSDIYLFDASVRFDGSSEFGSEKKYAPFWSTGIGINVHKYSFLKDNNVINQLKITATFGQTGKLNFAPYAARDIYDIFSENWYSTGMGVQLKALGNENLTWEKKNNYDLKIETSLFNNMIYLQASYYNSRTKDMVSSITIPSSFGFTTYYENLGEIENKGYELNLRLNLLNKNGFYLNFYGNMAHNENKILKISNSLREYNDKVDDYYSGYSSTTASDEKYSVPFTKYVEGGSTTSIFGMKSLGIDPASGKEVYEKRNGTITYEWDASEQQILGNSLPELSGSFGFNFSYKSLSLFMSKHPNKYIFYTSNINFSFVKK